MSNDLEPIELEIAMNSQDLLKEFQNLVSESQNVDNSLDKARKSFAEFVEEQFKAKGILSETASLTEKQTKALERHHQLLQYLKDKLAETVDPTQIALYNYQLQQAEIAIQDIISAANTKIELLNPVELEQQNRKLEDAGRIIDQIMDKSFEFAKPEELEVLSQEINKAENELDQLGTVLDFIEAKLDDFSDTPLFETLSNEIATANELLGRTPAVYDTAGNSINQLQDALKKFQEQLAAETNPENILILNQNIENCENTINRLKSAGKTGFDELGNKIVEQQPKLVQLQTELENLIQNMARLRLENKQNSEEYNNLKQRATEIRGALNAINSEVNATASTTNSLDMLLRVTSSISAGFTLAQGSAALFGDENEDVQKTIQKVTGAMAVLQSMQQIQAELKRADSIATVAQTTYQAIYARVVGQSTGALKNFRIALAATGIGIFIILLAELISNWDKVSKAIGLTSDELERNQAIGKKANELYGEKITKIQMLVELNKQEGLTTRQKERAVKDFNKEFGDTLGSVKDYIELERKIIANAPKYIQYLSVKSQAEAAYILSLEKQKRLLEQITALSTGDLKWYESLQNYSDKAYDKLWGMFGVKTETKYKISTDEQLKLLGLPTEAEFSKAIQGYSIVIQDNLKDMRKQQGEDSKLIGASLDLQKKAADLANSLGIKEDEKTKKPKTDKTLKERLDLLKEITKAENDYLANSLSGLDKDLKEIEQKYAKMRAEAEKLKLSQKDVDRINNLEVKEKGLATYKDNTDKLIKQLEREKELFKLYEEAKTIIGAEEITKRYGDQLKDAKSFGERLQQEISHITSKPEADRTGSENDRLKKLLEYQREYEKEVQLIQDDKYLDAYEATITLQERITSIETDYLNKRKEIEKISNEDLRAQKLLLLEKQKGDAVNAARNENFQIQNSRQKLFDTVLGLSKREFAIRLRTLKEYLEKSEGLLDDSTKKDLEKEIERAEGLFKMNQLSREEKDLLEKKEILVNKIANGQKKGTEQVQAEADELENINQNILENSQQKLEDLARIAYEISNAMSQWAQAVGTGNEELAKTLNVIAEIANDIGGLIKSFQQGGLIGLIVGLVVTLGKWIASIFSNARKNREADRKIMEEIKRWQAEAYQSQLDYNKVIRERWMYEARINDLYKSRVTNIREEMDAMKRQKGDVLKDMNSVWQRLLGSETIVDQGTTNKKFLGINRKKKRKWEASETVAEILGFSPEEVAEGIELTDELYRRLEEMNAQKPLTGDAKEAYEQLKKLKEEYGSIDEAMKQAEIDLKNALTGTTAQTLADSIKEGLASGKKSFADFADDIEGFLRNAILAGMESDLFAEQVQKLQDALADMMDDGVLTEDEKKRFQDMYMKIVNDANKQMDMLNQAGIDMTGSNQANSLKGAIKGITEEQADLLAGQFGGLRLAQLETNQILKSSAAYQMQACSDMIKIQTDIEFNTRKTYEMLELVYQQLGGTFQTVSTNSLTANGF